MISFREVIVSVYYSSFQPVRNLILPQWHEHNNKRNVIKVKCQLIYIRVLLFLKGIFLNKNYILNS